MMFSRYEALEILLSKDLKKQIALRSILKWDTDKTLKQNAEAIGKTYGAARIFAGRNGLDYISIGGKHGVDADDIKKRAYILLLESGFTNEQVGKLFGVSRQAVNEFIKLTRRKRIQKQAVQTGDVEKITTKSNIKEIIYENKIQNK